MNRELWIYAGVCAVFGAVLVLAISLALPLASCWPELPSRPHHGSWMRRG